MRWILFLLVFPLNASAQQAFLPIGSWKEHLPYSSAIDLAASESNIWCATPYSLFSASRTTGEIRKLSRTTGLNETGINTIHYHPERKQLFIGYNNSSIDIAEEKKITHLPDLERENITGDKSIYHFYTSGNRCYVSTGFGIVVLNLDKFEIAETWFPGAAGGNVKIHMFLSASGFHYAATAEGLKRASSSSGNLADFSQWTNLSGTNGLPSGMAQGVVLLGNRVIVQQQNRIYVQNGASWDLFFDNGWPIVSINSSENKLIVCQRTTGGDSQVIVLAPDGSVVHTIRSPGIIAFPRKGLATGTDYWIADQFTGLSKWNSNSFEQFPINAPQDLASAQLLVYNNVFYAAAGSVNEAWNYQFNRAGVYRLANGTWTNFNGFHYSRLDSLLDFITVAVDPRDESIWAGSFGGGLLHVANDQTFTIYKSGPLQQMIGDPGSYRVSGLAFDAASNLWISNYGAPQYLHVRKNNGTWKSFTTPFTLNENAVAQILIDDLDQKWIVSPKGNGLIVFNHGTSIDDLSDDRWRLFRAGAGNGNLPSSEVYSIAKDRNGFIWVGTSNGVGVIRCVNEIFNNSCAVSWPVISEGGFNNFLFKGEEVRSIAVDGADRKWIATQTGAWLVNAEGTAVLHHFTEDNSPLLSSDVKSIAVNGKTGEVFFATAKGISSFMGQATEGGNSHEEILIYPNPVPPGYGGTIAIKGLAQNSTVKITELNGRLVFQTRSLGGQAIWNGRDYNGREVRTGVYLVLIADEQKKEHAAGRIVFISR